MAAIPVEKDAFIGPIPIEIFARVAAQMGEPDRAIAALQKLLSIPYGDALASNVPLTPALLRLDPMFDPLRNDPRFQNSNRARRKKRSRGPLMSPFKKGTSEITNNKDQEQGQGILLGDHWNSVAGYQWLHSTLSARTH